MAEQNAYQVADWNGQSGERWVANQCVYRLIDPRVDMMETAEDRR